MRRNPSNPARLKVPLPATPRPVKGAIPAPLTLSVRKPNSGPNQSHNCYQPEGLPSLQSPITTNAPTKITTTAACLILPPTPIPKSGMVIYSAPPPNPSLPPSSSPVKVHPPELLQQLRQSLHPQSKPTYAYIPYTIPRIGGGVIEREHRLKMAVGRATKKVRTCRGCGVRGGGFGEAEGGAEMWYCLEVGCGWELCGRCVRGEEVKEGIRRS